MGQEMDDIGRLTVTLRVGESAIVETPQGMVCVKVVRHNGAEGLSVQVAAPRKFNIKRSSEMSGG